MHNTLLTGDHLIVDKLAYAPPDAISKHLLPYEESSAATSSSSAIPRHKEDIVSACIGIPGDHLKLVNKQVFINGNR